METAKLALRRRSTKAAVTERPAEPALRARQSA
jgi:hypothetical protein